MNYTTIDSDNLINFFSSEPQKQTEPLKKSTGQVDSTFDTIIDELLADSLLNNEDNYSSMINPFTVITTSKAIMLYMYMSYLIHRSLEPLLCIPVVFCDTIWYLHIS